MNDPHLHRPPAPTIDPDTAARVRSGFERMGVALTTMGPRMAVAAAALTAVATKPRASTHGPTHRKRPRRP